jgi:hypothetical protein
MKQIKDALQYALKLLKHEAEKGRYPELALQEKGGEGFQPITKAIDLIEIDNQPIQFNINDKVKVKVTECGYKYWLDYENQFCEYLPSIQKMELKHLKEKEDTDGYVTFQLWVLMEIFGRHMKGGFDNPVGTNIILLPEN